VRACDTCKVFAACITHRDIIRCLPEWFQTEPMFRCPKCHKEEGAVPAVSHT
jgi:hypothetical protein